VSRKMFTGRRRRHGESGVRQTVGTWKSCVAPGEWAWHASHARRRTWPRWCRRWRCRHAHGSAPTPCQAHASAAGGCTGSGCTNAVARASAPGCRRPERRRVVMNALSLTARFARWPPLRVRITRQSRSVLRQRVAVPARLTCWSSGVAATTRCQIRQVARSRSEAAPICSTPVRKRRRDDSVRPGAASAGAGSVGDVRRVGHRSFSDRVDHSVAAAPAPASLLGTARPPRAGTTGTTGAAGSRRPPAARRRTRPAPATRRLSNAPTRHGAVTVTCMSCRQAPRPIVPKRLGAQRPVSH